MCLSALLNGDDLEHILKCTLESRPECPTLVIVKFGVFFSTLRSSNNLAMLYYMFCTKEATAYLTRRKISLHLASQVVGRMGKPA